MKRSNERILTTHVGSLPRPNGWDRWTPENDDALRDAVRDVITKQRDAGLDVVNEGEYTKGGDWLAYLEDRFTGFEPRPDTAPLITQGKDREEFADFYKEASARGTLFYAPAGVPRSLRPAYVCTGPVTYQNVAALEREINTFKPLVDPAECFISATAPASIEPYRRNEYYKSQDEFLEAIAEAMRVEYEAIANAGFILQVDDAWLPALWDRIGIEMGLDAYRDYCMHRVEVLNHALRNIPEGQIRYHLCWGSWHGPHAHDIELEKLVDIMLRVKATAYLFEAANARHEHEYALWERVKLPAGKIVIPGVVTHSTDVVEHPELVAQRIVRFARLVGKENVIAGTDCGFGGRSHPQIAWAKLRSLTAGAARASRELF
jgi:5-methyltetrahydropteroyltriglutamate--homocysteine methyltransferase